MAGFNERGSMQSDQAEKLRLAELPNSNGDAPKPRASLVQELLTLEEAAFVLSVSTRTLKPMVAADDLPPGAVVWIHGKMRRFSAWVLQQWCRKGCPAVRGK